MLALVARAVGEPTEAQYAYCPEPATNRVPKTKMHVDDELAAGVGVALVLAHATDS
jgi:hypothetical protein